MSFCPHRQVAFLGSKACLKGEAGTVRSRNTGWRHTDGGQFRICLRIMIKANRIMKKIHFIENPR